VLGCEHRRVGWRIAGLSALAVMDGKRCIDDRVERAQRSGRMLPAAVAVAGLWLAMAFTAVFAPDLITGSQHEHLPIVAMTIWMWGMVATGFVLFGAAFRCGTGRPGGV
jgi:hypothetical protein